jgi:uncharacterized Rmd1/YagE family protein
MSILSVHAYGFASTFKLRDLEPAFRSLGHARVEKDRLLVDGGDGRYGVAYDFGAVVFVGVDSGVQVHTIAALHKLLPPEPYPPTTESFLIETVPDRPLEVRFDRVIVPEVTPAVVDIVAEVLAQSVAMDYYMKDVEEIETETDRLAALLRTRGKVPRNVRELVQFIGLCIATRNDVISTLALFDKPDATWESEQLDRLWNGLHHMLELGDRYRALEAKLRMFQDNLVVLVDLARQRETIALETTVAFLILLEMLVMIWQVLSTTGHIR